MKNRDLAFGVKIGRFGMLCATDLITQPPFGMDEYVLNEEYIAAAGQPSRRQLPQSSSTFSPRTCSPPKGFFMR